MKDLFSTGYRLSRREFLKGAAIAGAAGLTAPLISCGSGSGGYDVVIQNGTVYDGSSRWVT